MYTSKLLKLIRTLSVKEMRWLAKFVRSPYHNSNEDVVVLFDLIRKYHPDCTSSQLLKENVYNKIWPGKSYNDRALRLLMFRLSDVVEDFLVAQWVRENKIESGKLLVSALGERDLYDLFTKKTDTLLAELEQQSYRDEKYYELLWQLKLHWLSHPETVRLQVPMEYFHEIVALLDNFYAVAKFRHSSDLLNRQNILPEHYDILLLKELRELVSQAAAFQENKVLQVYSDLICMIEAPLEEEYYRKVEQSFMKNQQLFKAADQSAILRSLINVSTQLYLSGRSAYLKNQLQLYLLGLEGGLFIEKGKLPESTFLNIVVTATILKEQQWTRHFIDQYAAVMSDNMLNFSEAYWHFAEQDFQQSNTFLNKVKEQDISHQLRKKLLSLRNHYEIFCQDYSYYALFLDESRAFEKFVRRSEQITQRRAKGYLNFLTCIRKIGKLKADNNKVKNKQWAGLMEEIAQLHPLEARPWLLEKGSEL